METPPINLMLTIEAVTRLGSFKLAAAALHMTPSAISHRVRSLEQRLGQPLFDRVGQGIQPTPHALRLAEVVSRATGEISATWDDIRQQLQPAVLRLSCLAAFAENFILPEMKRFKRIFPQLEISLTSTLYSGSAQELRNDILINAGHHPGVEWWTEVIMPLDMQAIVAVGRRDAMIKGGKLRGPLLAYTDESFRWPEVARRMGLTYDPAAAIITLDSVAAACVAAERGLGIALAPVVTAQRMVHAGTVETIGHALPTGLSYWLAVKRDRKQTAASAALRRWVLAAVA